MASVVKCPNCMGTFPKPTVEGKFPCPHCGQKLRFNSAAPKANPGAGDPPRPHAGATAASAAPRAAPRAKTASAKGSGAGLGLIALGVGALAFGALYLNARRDNHALRLARDAARADLAAAQAAASATSQPLIQTVAAATVANDDDARALAKLRGEAEALREQLAEAAAVRERADALIATLRADAEEHGKQLALEQKRADELARAVAALEAEARLNAAATAADDDDVSGGDSPEGDNPELADASAPASPAKTPKSADKSKKEKSPRALTWSGKPRDVNGAKEFDAAIAQGVTLVDFWAPWCGPCRAVAPTLNTVAKDIGKKAKIAKVNVDDNKELAQRFRVTGIPCLILFVDGQEVSRYRGNRTKESFMDYLEAAAKKNKK